LVALKVASSTERNDEILLREPAFNIVSLNAASHDAIELAMEALSHPAELLEQRRKPLGPREFLTAVFDWNYWITLQCVASFDRRRVSPLPEWMRHAIYAHNLERRFDPFLHTVWRAERLRGQIPSSPDLTYLGAESRDVIAKEIEKTVGQLQHPDKAEDDYRRHWLGLYLRNKPFTIKDIEPLWQDPLLSWTAANTIRRCENPPEITEELVRMYRVSKATSDSSPKAAMFRWRLVHALGRGTTAALKMLTDVALDPFENADARYGAFRSLVELVVTKGTGQEQMEILDVVESGLSELFAGESARDLSRVRREIRRTCAFNEPCVRGRNGWLEDWLAKGLPKFSRILREGEAWARKTQTLNLEAEIWKEWAIAAEAAPKHSPEARREKWLEVIERDQ
jgi:hypothetical protein